MAFQWVRAIEQQDWEAMGDLLARDAVYEDPTMRFFGGDAIHLKGRQAIVDFWETSSRDSGAENIRYRIDSWFETGGVTVLNLHLTLTVGGAFWDVNRERIELSGSQTTILTVHEGHIVHAIDYVDYAAAMQRIDALRSRYGAVE